MTRPFPERAAGPTIRPGRPDPGPMRVILGASAVAALSVLTVGLSHPAPPTDVPDVQFDTNMAGPPLAAPMPPVEVRHLITYVQLLPGQTAPPGARVITPDAPAPRIVITTTQPSTPRQTVQQPAETQPKRRIRTRQSGTP